jgi:polyphosphate:AMP phosphotransferase
MFESAELGHSVAKAVWKKEVPSLREALLDVQYDLMDDAGFPVIILVGGVDGAGRSETVNLLNEWMDPRFIATHGMGEPTDEEKERPRMWRFWRSLPPKGRIGIFFGSWYTQAILRRVYGENDNADLDQAMEDAVRFERMLTEEGALVLKFWMHLSKKKQKKRLTALEQDPKTRWRVTERDWQHYKLYDKFVVVCERALRHTSSANAPWIIVEGEDEYYRGLTVGKTILHAVRQRLANPAVAAEISAPPLMPPIDSLHVLKSLDLTQNLDRKDYEARLEEYQGRLNLLTRHNKYKNHSVVVVFEGNDAAGKGSAVRRITQALDARFYHVAPIAAPSEEERSQPYLWRFWRHMPKRARLQIFDRSWYGRVLVERVEGYCSRSDWMRAYGEINDFEEQMVRHGIIVVKFWLSISQEEQLKRFKAREQTPFKRFKITDDDWRNRDKWAEYEQAVCDMVDRTSTEIAPWTLVEANDKYFARIKVLKTLCERIEAGLKG